MNIPPVDAANIAAQRLDAVAPVNANTVSPTVTVTVTGADATASIVEFSPLAHLLAVTVLFQTPQAGTSAGSTNLSFQQLVQAADNFVKAFNSFQNTINASSATPFESAFDSALLTALQNQNIQSGSASVQSFIDSMAQLGITFQGPTNLINPNQFQFNLSALEMAYKANSTQSSSLLTNAFQALSSIEQQLLLAQVSQTVDASLMTTQMASAVSVANAAAKGTNTVNGANAGSGNATVTAGTAVTQPSTAAAGTAAPGTAATGTAAAATIASAGAGATAPVNAPVTVAATATVPAPATMDSAIKDPLIAQAIAAYRVGETIEHTPADLPATALSEVVPDIIKSDRVEPVGPDTHRGTGAHTR